MIQLDYTYTGIPIIIKSNGASVAADSLPTAVLYRGGVATVVPVTVAEVTPLTTPGMYVASFTTLGTGDGWAKTDRLFVRVEADIGGKPFDEVVWDSFAEPDAVMRGTENASTFDHSTDLVDVGYIESTDATDFFVSMVSSITSPLAAVAANVATILGKWAGVTSFRAWIGAVVGKSADPTTLAEINATAAGAGYSNVTHSLETTADKLTTERLAKIDGAMQAAGEGFTGETLSDQIDGVGSELTLSPEDKQSIITGTVNGVLAVKSRIPDAVAGLYRSKVGDTWQQTFELAAPAADRIILAVKDALTDSDNDSILLIDTVAGLLRVKGAAAADAAQGTLTSDGEAIQLLVSSTVMKELTAARYKLIVKALDVGNDTTLEYDAVFDLYQSGIEAIST